MSNTTIQSSPNLKDIKNRILLEEDRIHKKFNWHFNEYLREVVRDDNADELMLNADEYYYWTERELDIKNILNDLDNYESENESDQTILNHKLFDLYKYVNEKIINHPYHKVDLKVTKDIEKMKENNKYFEIIEIPFDEAKKDEIIKFLFDNLNKFIHCEYETFERHFKDNGEKFIQLTWKGTELEIVQLFRDLKRERIIFVKHKNVLISTHFINDKGQQFKPKQLGVVTSKLTNCKESELISNLIEKLKLATNF